MPATAPLDKPEEDEEDAGEEAGLPVAVPVAVAVDGATSDGSGSPGVNWIVVLAAYSSCVWRVHVAFYKSQRG